VAVGAGGVPAVAYHSHNPNPVARYAVCRSAGCSTGVSPVWTYQDLDASGNVGHHMTVFTDPVTKQPRAAYQDANSFLRYATCSGACDHATGTWTFGTVDSSSNNVGLWNSISVSPAGVPSIAYEDDTFHQIKLARCTANCSSATASTWNVRVLTTLSPSSVNFYPRLQFDASNQAHITYIDPLAKILNYAIEVGLTGTFNTFQIDTGVTDGHSSFILTPLGSTHVTYALTTGLKYYPFGD
jgi:hypothetical protein